MCSHNENEYVAYSRYDPNTILSACHVDGDWGECAGFCIRTQAIQIKIVLLIALLALTRKFIILDLNKTSAEMMLGLAAITLVLGVTYWLIRERDDQSPATPKREHNPSLLSHPPEARR
jgi:Phosphate-starvation-inducible E family